MNWTENIAIVGLAIHVLAEVIIIIRVLLRPHRQPASRIAWIVIIIALPVFGMLAYFLFGEVNIGRRRLLRRHTIVSDMAQLVDEVSADRKIPSSALPESYSELFRVGRSISFMPLVNGNVARLLADSNAFIDSLVADIDAAKNHVHVLFYIWLTDNNGCKVIEALRRAARRGVTCRVMADDIGSRKLIRSRHWRAMQDDGIRLAAAFPVGNPLFRLFAGRIDLRNHRKIVVIDGGISYCGSQNCADPEFRIKARYAPWVDIMIRVEGPVSRQNQYLFACDWMSHVDEDLTDVIKQPVIPVLPGIVGQVIGAGPTLRYSAMPEMLSSLMYAARSELVITTPYFVPDESMLNALCAAAYRGVDTTIILPARNDSWVVAAASRSYYSDLIAAGIRIYEFTDGLLHSKTITLDGTLVLIGSANLDRRSFDLNYENNMLFYDNVLTAEVRQRQQNYIDRSRLVCSDEIKAWPVRRRLWNNTIAMLGPLF